MDERNSREGAVCMARVVYTTHARRVLRRFTKRKTVFVKRPSVIIRRAVIARLVAPETTEINSKRRLYITRRIIVKTRTNIRRRELNATYVRNEISHPPTRFYNYAGRGPANKRTNQKNRSRKRSGSPLLSPATRTRLNITISQHATKRYERSTVRRDVTLPGNRAPSEGVRG